MHKIAHILLKTTKYLLLSLLLLILFYIARSLLNGNSDISFDIQVNYLIASVVFASIYFIFLQRRLRIWEVLFHELTHVTFALLFFNKIEGFNVSFSGGVTSYSGRKNVIISLAPYTIPILPLLLMALSLIISHDYLYIVHYLVMILYVWFLLSLINQFRLQQDDLSESGLVFSILTIICMNIFIGLFVVSFLTMSVDEYITLIIEGLIWMKNWVT